MEYRPLHDCDVEVFKKGDWSIVRCKGMKQGESNLLIAHISIECDVPYDTTSEAWYVDPVRDHSRYFKCRCGKDVPEVVKGLWMLGSFDHVAKEV